MKKKTSPIVDAINTVHECLEEHIRTIDVHGCRIKKVIQDIEWNLDKAASHCFTNSNFAQALGLVRALRELLGKERIE